MASGETTLNEILADLEGGYTRSLAFVVPPGVSWPLPAYEIAIMTAGEVRAMGIDDAELTVVTPEDAPLGIFGRAASEAVAKLLDEAGVAVRTGVYARVEGGALRLTPGDGELRPQRIVALPVLEGPAIPGVPADEGGFIPIDEHGRVTGVDDMYAAGDGTTFPVKQGGLACQQADAAAAAIAAQAGADVRPEPFRPVLRGKLMTGRGGTYLRHAMSGGGGESRSSEFMLWSPPTKVSGRYLSQWLQYLDAPAAGEPHVEVEVPLDTAEAAMRLDPYSPPYRIPQI
jgi:sulfide:quinone oxidoreductase